MSKMSLVVNGITLTGEASDVLRTASKLGYHVNPNIFYNSESRGRILISEMETTHLRNAILKQYREWVDSLRGISDNHDFVSKLIGGISDPVFKNMLIELNKRDD